MRNKRASGFTLVEMLVVIAIIAVLVSLLLPALNKTREAAKSAVCMSNLRQCGLGLQTYAVAFDQYMPVYRVKGGQIHAWPFFLAYGEDMWDAAGQPVYVQRNVCICPTNLHYADDYSNLNLTSVAYAMFLVSSSAAGTQPVYFNSHFQRTIPKIPTPAAPNDDWAVKMQKLTALPTPAASTVWLGDSLSMNTSSYGGGGHMYGIFCDQTSGPYTSAINVLHNGTRANVLFYDGHAESMTDMQLRHNTATRVRYFYSTGGTYYSLP